MRLFSHLCWRLPKTLLVDVICVLLWHFWSWNAWLPPAESSSHIQSLFPLVSALPFVSIAFLALLQSVFLPGSHQILKLLNLSNWLATRSFCLISFFFWSWSFTTKRRREPYLNLVGDCSQALFPPFSKKLGSK